jgi:hypothetical protein
MDISTIFQISGLVSVTIISLVGILTHHYSGETFCYLISGGFFVLFIGDIMVPTNTTLGIVVSITVTYFAFCFSVFYAILGAYRGSKSHNRSLKIP